MNRIETKIIIAVTSRLAAAKDSQAKMEMIEELSENLYQHYLDLVASGLDEETAYRQSMENLGDVDELLRYLAETENDGGDGQNREDGHSAGSIYGDGEVREDGDAGPDPMDGSAAGGQGSGQRRRSTGTFTFSTGGLEDSINDIVSAALSGAKEAMDYAKEAMNSAKDAAKDAARYASEQIKDSGSGGIFVDLSAGSYRKVESESVESEGIHTLDVKLTNGDIHLCFAEDVNAPVEITGDTKEIQTVLRGEGVICVRQGNTASSSFLFHRGVRSSDIEIRIPRRCFTAISLTTVNGDIHLDDGLSCRTLRVQTVSGDLEAGTICADKVNVQTVSGDIRMSDANGGLEGSGKMNVCSVSTVSGDIFFFGEGQDVSCTSVSGDLRLLPLGSFSRVKASSKSGDVQLALSEDRGFWLTYQTVSGRFASELPLAGTMEKRKGRVSCLGGGDAEIQLSSTSGDIDVRKR